MRSVREGLAALCGLLFLVFAAIHLRHAAFPVFPSSQSRRNDQVQVVFSATSIHLFLVHAPQLRFLFLSMCVLYKVAD